MSPVVLRSGQYTVAIYTKDHPPAHVHVRSHLRTPHPGAARHPSPTQGRGEIPAYLPFSPRWEKGPGVEGGFSNGLLKMLIMKPGLHSRRLK